ncbi:MAG: hypothetical protein QW076_01665 [Candidatus Anstonellales archaeon]
MTHIIIVYDLKAKSSINYNKLKRIFYYYLKKYFQKNNDIFMLSKSAVLINENHLIYFLQTVKKIGIENIEFFIIYYYKIISKSELIK